MVIMHMVIMWTLYIFLVSSPFIKWIGPHHGGAMIGKGYHTGRRLSRVCRDVQLGPWSLRFPSPT